MLFIFKLYSTINGCCYHHCPPLFMSIYNPSNSDCSCSVVFRMWSSRLCLDLFLCCSPIQASLSHPFCALSVFFHCCSYLLIKQFHAHYICLVIILSCRHDSCPSLSIFIFRYIYGLIISVVFALYFFILHVFLARDFHYSLAW